MIEIVSLKNITIPYNYVLVKADPNYDFVEIETPSGKVELQLSYFVQDKTKYLSISGEVVKAPKALFFFDKKGIDPQSKIGFDFEGYMRNTNDFKTDIRVIEGDKVYFSYTQQLDAEKESRLLKTEIGICILIKYSSLYGKKTDEGITPLNGWVFFKRDQMPDKIELNNGIIVFQKHGKYDVNQGEIISADEPITSYLDSEPDPVIDLIPKERVLIAKGGGHRMSYEVGDGIKELVDIEVLRRTHILAQLN